MDIKNVGMIVSTWAKKEPLIQRVFIYGSRVRKDYRSDSDLDLAVVLDPEEFTPSDDSGGLATWAYENKRWAKELQDFLPYQIQLEYYDGDQSPTIKAGITRSSVLVYEKEIKDI